MKRHTRKLLIDRAVKTTSRLRADTSNMTATLRITLLALVCALAASLRAATIPVTSTADDGPDTLRAALACAVDGDTIDATGVSGPIILLSTGELVVNDSVTLLGPGPANLTVDANHLSRVFHITPFHTVIIDGLRIINGGDVFGAAEDVGGGIFNDHSSLTVNNCVLSGNSAGLSFGGGIFNSGGGPDSVLGGGPGGATLTVTASTLTGNSAFFGSAIVNIGDGDGNATVTLVNSMLLNNFATFSPANGGSYGNGGIYNIGGTPGNATLTVIKSTLSGNPGIINQFGRVDITTSTLSGNGFKINIGGAEEIDGIDNSGGLVRVANSTLRGTPILNLFGATEIGNSILDTGGFPGLLNIFPFDTVVSHGFNLSSDNAGGFLTAASDQILKNPLLGPLLDNGGPTLTHAPLSGSPVIDQGRADTIGDLTAATDQRGLPRTLDDSGIANQPFGDSTDIGAVELAVPNHPPVAKCKNVTALSTGSGSILVDDGSFDPDPGDAITIAQTPPGPYPIGATTVTLTVTDSHGAPSSCTAVVTVLAVGDLSISKSVVSGQAKPGQVLTYTIIVTNAGPNPASGVVVNDAVPQGTTFVNASPAPSSAPPVGAGGTVAWTPGNLASGASVTLTLTVKVSVKGNTLIVNTATVTSSSSDPNSANNTATVTSKRITK